MLWLIVKYSGETREEYKSEKVEQKLSPGVNLACKGFDNLDVAEEQQRLGIGLLQPRILLISAPILVDSRPRTRRGRHPGVRRFRFDQIWLRPSKQKFDQIRYLKFARRRQQIRLRSASVRGFKCNRRDFGDGHDQCSAISAPT